ncbi:HAD family phosphatase [Comamonas piscis]|uniref:HAD family phosphatase n=1 Tax=Comamonas piscis TaxID=1562974 RepID=A0A7G5EKX0_9BURK|nr:HAD family phosphatase [Comamonas piscis]QMV74645.1 HAD family phosphatase [Comamonas piscis]WSO33109.1 HAD family phosphatase [Comamonas piscis]
MNGLQIDTVIFDLGNVLIQWDPRHLYRKIFGPDVAAMEAFLAEVCSPDWNERQDQGRPWREGIAEAIERHPSQEANIRAFYDRWEEMMPGANDEVVDLLRELGQGHLRLLALTNWSTETFPIAQARFDFLNWFEGIVVSGHERLVKPQADIFELTIQRFGLIPTSTLFIDDSLRNVEAARRAGMNAIHFVGVDDLRARLREVGLAIA